MAEQAVEDANNAVALNFLALQSTFSEQASSSKTETSSTPAYTQISQLSEIVTGSDQTDTTADQHVKSLQFLITDAYGRADSKLEKSEAAYGAVQEQLKTAKAAFTKAEENLNSVKAELAAATAAASGS